MCQCVTVADKKDKQSDYREVKKERKDFSVVFCVEYLVQKCGN